MTEQLTEVRDWRVTIPLLPDDGRPPFQVAYRVPAATREDALFLAEPVALHIATQTRTVVNLPDLDAVDVNNLPAPDDVAYTLGEKLDELAYWRKVVAALADKFPMMLMLSADEYGAADGDTVITVPGPDDMMVFITGTTVDAVVGEAQARGVQPEPELLPAHDAVAGVDLPAHAGRQLRMGSVWYEIDDAGPTDDGRTQIRVPDERTFTFDNKTLLAVRDLLPVLDGEEEDPEVRRIRAYRLVNHEYGPLMVLDQGRWRTLEKATGPNVHGFVQLTLEGRDDFSVEYDLTMLARPLSWTVDGAQLAGSDAIGRQVLLDGGWRDIAGGARMADKDGWYEVVTANPEHHVAVEAGDEYQARDMPNGWA